MHATEEVPAAFKNIALFPDSIPTAPLLRISLKKLLDSDSEELRRLWSACTELGFFYLDLRNARNDGGTLDGDNYVQEADRLFGVSEEFFSLPLDEKVKYDFKDQGSYFGYKGYGGGITDKKGTPDRNEFYNASLSRASISKDDILSQSSPIPAPTCLTPHRSLVSSFIHHSHAIVTLLLDRLNDRLHLPPGTLPNLHRLSAISGDQVRFVCSPPQPTSDRRAALGSHTDFGSVTLLFNKLGGLQILPPGADRDDDAGYLYVRPLPGHCIVNLGDAMVKFTRGVLRSNVHKVVNPPGEQARSVRYSLVYFARPEDEVKLRALGGSDVIGEEVGEEEDISSKEWILRRALGRRGVGEWGKSEGTESVRRQAVAAT